VHMTRRPRNRPRQPYRLIAFVRLHPFAWRREVLSSSGQLDDLGWAHLCAWPESLGRKS